mmetsp:Transcript_35609/g.68708  ORF Transcript_35609/g.68708 Transcript_35609/m.68708 type:complete len:283 (+) Transcript_35609:51-899(+)
MPILKVQNVAGNLVYSTDTCPLTVTVLKTEIETCRGIPVSLQQLLQGTQILSESTILEPAALALTLVVDESPLFTWDVERNPNRNLLDGDASTVRFREDTVDYVNVLTCAPVLQGVHFFEFVMHHIGDEQWCGVCCDRAFAGYRGESDCWLYYCGRRWSKRGALHAPREHQHVQDFAGVASGDIIGLLLDVDRGGLTFLMNGAIQGAYRVPARQPLYVSTSLDMPGDHVELKKPPLADCPQSAMRALDEFLTSEQGIVADLAIPVSQDEAFLSDDSDLTDPE